MSSGPSQASSPAAGLAPLKPFLARVRAADRAALLLDFDGTLAPFHEDRDRAEPYEGVRGRLEAILHQGRTHVAIVSGRSARDVDARLTLRPRPEIWGSHGLELWSPGQDVALPTLAPGARRFLDQEFAWGRAQGWADRVERKPAGVALHWRGLDRALAAAMADAAAGRWGGPACPPAFALHGFDGGVELRLREATKARPVREVRRLLGADAPVAYLGDDLTDEDAFGALAPTDLGALVRPTPRPTLATAWIRPPAELLGFLDAWCDARRPNR